MTQALLLNLHGGLTSKLSLLRSFVSSLLPQFVCLSEVLSASSPKVPSVLNDFFPGYQVVHNLTPQHGGVVILISDTVLDRVSVIDKQHYSVHVRFDQVSLHFVYGPQSHKKEFWGKVISQAIDPKTIVLGDLNLPLHKDISKIPYWGPHKNTFYNVWSISDHNAIPFTFFGASSSSLHKFSTPDGAIATFTLDCSASALDAAPDLCPDHLPVVINIPITADSLRPYRDQPPSALVLLFKFHKFNEHNIAAFNHAITKERCHSLEDFELEVKYAASTRLPHRTKATHKFPHTNSRSHPLNHRINVLIQAGFALSRHRWQWFFDHRQLWLRNCPVQLKKTPLADLKLLWSRAFNLISSSIVVLRRIVAKSLQSNNRKLIAKRVQLLREAAASRSSKFFQFFSRHKKKRSDIVALQHNGKTVSKPQEVLEAMQAQWQEIYNGPELPMPDKPQCSSPLFTVNIVRDALFSMSNSSSPGPDKIPYRVLKLLNSDNLQLWTDLINKAFNEGSFPHSWTQSATILLHKGGPKSLILNYRPIALLPTLYKSVAASVAQLLNSKYDQYLLPNQYGFRKGQRISVPIFRIITFFKSMGKSVKEAWCFYTDIKKAYDTVDHQLVMRALHDAKVDERVCYFVAFILKHNTTQIHTTAGTTKLIFLQRGIKQGCPLSPTLFNFAIAFVLRQAKLQGLLNVFADDTSNFSHDLFTAWHDFCALRDLLLSFGMQLGYDNTAKTCVTSNLDTATAKNRLQAIGCTLPYLPRDQAYRYLGIMICADGSWEIAKERCQTFLRAFLAKLRPSFADPFHFSTIVNSILFGWLRFQFLHVPYTSKEVVSLEQSIGRAIYQKARLRGYHSLFYLKLSTKEGGMAMIDLQTLLLRTQLDSHSLSTTATHPWNDIILENIRKAGLTSLCRIPPSVQTDSPSTLPVTPWILKEDRTYIGYSNQTVTRFAALPKFTPLPVAQQIALCMAITWSRAPIVCSADWSASLSSKLPIVIGRCINDNKSRWSISNKLVMPHVYVPPLTSCALVETSTSHQWLPTLLLMDGHKIVHHVQKFLLKHFRDQFFKRRSSSNGLKDTGTALLLQTLTKAYVPSFKDFPDGAGHLRLFRFKVLFRKLYIDYQPLQCHICGIQHNSAFDLFSCAKDRNKAKWNAISAENILNFLGISDSSQTPEQSCNQNLLESHRIWINQCSSSFK